MKWKIIISTVVGNALELYDFILYGFLATFISQSFFPAQDEFTTLLLAFSVFAAACIVRPISALFFGRMGDTQGRRKTLLFSVNMMSLSTFLVGILPSYHSIGITAGMLLILLRLAQGFSVAGEETGAAVYLTEESNATNRGLMTSFVLASVHIGLLLGSVVCLVISSLLTLEQMQDFGWRIPFLLALPLGIVASYLRARTQESTEFVQVIANAKKKSENDPITLLFNNHKLDLLKATGICCVFAVTIYLFTIYLPNYLQTHLDYNSSLYLTIIGLIVLSILCPVFGYLSDKFGALLLLKVSCILFLTLSFPVFLLLESLVLMHVVLGYFLMALFLLPMMGSLFAIIVTLFPIHIRYSGVSFAFNMAFTIFGSSTPIIALYLQNSSWGMQGIAFYVTLAALLSLTVAVILQKNKVMNNLAIEEVR